MRISDLALVVSGLRCGWPALADELTFPGADGYGAIATGWRDGGVVRVTSLASDGPRTRRACAGNGDTPRVCVFAVSGAIVLDRPIRPGFNLHVAGQSAPGDGIHIRVEGRRQGPLILEDSFDVVLRFVGLRPGPSSESSPIVDALTIERFERLHLGSLSIAFATDETFNMYVFGERSADITLAHSLLALSLYRANHPDGRRSKGALICATQGVDFTSGRTSLRRGLFTYHSDRNPDKKAIFNGSVEAVNNMFYNEINQFLGGVYGPAGYIPVICAENIEMSGPETVRNVAAALQVVDWTEAAIETAAWDSVLLSRDGCADGRNALPLDATAETATIATSIHAVATVPSAEEAYVHVMVRADRRAHTSLERRGINSVFAFTEKVFDEVHMLSGSPPVTAIYDVETGRAVLAGEIPDNAVAVH